MAWNQSQQLDNHADVLLNAFKDIGLTVNVGKTKYWAVHFNVMVYIQTICYNAVLSLFPPLSLPNVLCDPTVLISRKVTPFEAMTGRTAPSSDCLLAEVSWGFPRL